MESYSDYMRRRSHEEQDAADKSSSPKAREIHNELAGRYRDAADEKPPPKSPDGPARACLSEDFRILE